jgi:hypothetical protein
MISDLTGFPLPPSDPVPGEESDIVALQSKASFLTFAREILKLPEMLGRDIYDWQAGAMLEFDEASARMVQVSVRTPNGSGKSAVLIPALALGWLFFYPKGRVVITTADGKQLDGQVMPAIEAHRDKFPAWKFIEREITTPTGGRLVAFTTDQAGRAEGWHKLDDEEGPLLMIVDEAKTVADAIFSAIDRCTYNAILLTSSPGLMHGRFYETQTNPLLGYTRIKVGLLDCPHISKEKIDRIIATHGADSQFTRSALHGDFMLAEGETKFDREGLDHIRAMAAQGHGLVRLGRLEESRATGTAIWLPDDSGWLWMDEKPMPGGEYLITVDPNTCEQAEGTEERDNTACAVIRKGWFDSDGEHPDHVVATLHWPGGVKWDSDVLAKRIKLLADHYGGCMAVVEANNFGSALIAKLQALHVRLWHRTKIDDVNPNKETKLVGFLSTSRSREHWIQAMAAAIREKALICRYQPAAQEFLTFITLPSGRSEAQGGYHDDWVAAIGIGLVVRCFTTFRATIEQRVGAYAHTDNWGRPYDTQPGISTMGGVNKWGACG